MYFEANGKLNLFEQGCYGDNFLNRDLPRPSNIIPYFINSKLCSSSCLKFPLYNNGKGYSFSGIQTDGVNI